MSSTSEALASACSVATASTGGAAPTGDAVTVAAIGEPVAPAALAAADQDAPALGVGDDVEEAVDVGVCVGLADALGIAAAAFNGSNHRRTAPEIASALRVPGDAVGVAAADGGAGESDADADTDGVSWCDASGDGATLA